MTPDQIIQLRQKLKIAQAFYKNNFFHSCGRTIDEALALLPCPTCNGTGREIKFSPGQREFGGDASSSYEIPCPDCQ